MLRSTGDHHQGYSYVIAMYTIESIGVWQYTIRSALLPRTYLCPVQLPTVLLDSRHGFYGTDFNSLILMCL